jgi:predicted DNA-binding transcriptional regulator AlpA
MLEIKTTIDGTEVIDIAKVSQITGYNLNKLYELLRYNLFPEPLRVKNKNFWKRSEIENYIAKQRNVTK